MKKTAPCALSLALVPAVCRADVGSLGHLVVTALAAFLAVWGALSLAVFLLLRRKKPAARRFGWAALFFLAPALLLAALTLLELLKERSGLFG